MRLVRALRDAWLCVLVHVAAWIPLGVLIWDTAHGGLGVNPIQEATFRTGKTALTLLICSLACTPAATLLHLTWAVPLRRPLGLYAFMYAGVHLFIFAVVDYWLDFDLIQRDAILKKPYIFVGLTAFLLLTPLAITSTRGWMRRLGRRWKLLHRLIYLAAPLVILHFVWLVKADKREPLTYGAVMLLLLALRAPPLRRAALRLRYRRAQRRLALAPRPAGGGRDAEALVSEDRSRRMATPAWSSALALVRRRVRQRPDAAGLPEAQQAHRHRLRSVLQEDVWS